MSDQQSITEFLTQRWDEIEAIARKATQARWKLWAMEVRADAGGDSDLDKSLPVADTHHEAGLRTFNATHIAQHDPAYVLADIAAKRAILAEHVLVESDDWRAQQKGEWSTPEALQYGCRRCDDEDGYYIYGTNGCRTVRLLAAPFAVHADFDSDWSLP